MRQRVLTVQREQDDLVALAAFRQHLLDIHLLKILVGIHHQRLGVLVADGDLESDLVHRHARSRRQLGGADRQLTGRRGGEAAFAPGRIIVHHDLVIQKSSGAMLKEFLAEGQMTSRAAKQDKRKAGYLMHKHYFLK